MKNFTKPNSSEKHIGGLVFWPKKEHLKAMGKDFYPSLKIWVDAKKPDNAYIYDSVDTLLASGIPILDAKLFRGVWHRQINPKGLQKAVVTIHQSLVVPVTPAVSHKTVNVIRASDPKEHHKMSYN